jgi:hypothetical protein
MADILTAEQIAKRTVDKEGIANIRAINKLYRMQDDSHLYPVNNRFNATERAIRRIRRGGMAIYGLEYCCVLETEISDIVNSCD